MLINYSSRAFEFRYTPKSHTLLCKLCEILLVIFKNTATMQIVRTLSDKYMLK